MEKNINNKKVVLGVKGFNKDMTCRGFQYEVGKEYTHKGEVKACNSGFHFCENPLDVFGYYNPSEGKFCEVEGSGNISTDTDDSKVACSNLKIGAEISLHNLVDLGVKFVLSKIDTKKKQIISKNKKISTNTGDRSASTNTGYQSASTNTGDRSASTNTGDRSASTVSGKKSVAIAIGYESKAMGSLGCWIVVSDWKQIKGEYHIIDVQCKLVDGKKIKADTFYSLKNGKFIEVK